MTVDKESQRWTFTSRFLAKKGQARFLQRLERARSFFPELDGHTVKVGTTINVPGKADSKSKAIYFRSRNVSNYVLGHELTHLLQEMGEVPKGERSCDIFALARRVEFCDEAPNYLKIPRGLQDGNGFIKKEFRDLVHDTARTAINMRKSGNRRYISWFERTLKNSLVKEYRIPDADSQPIKRTPKEVSTQTSLDIF